MNTINDGGQAFPCVDSDSSGQMHLRDGGMSLRDYLAAKALQGLLCNPEMRRDWGPKEWAEESYRHADAMLAEREAK